MSKLKTKQVAGLNAGSTGQALTSNGDGEIPTFQNIVAPAGTLTGTVLASNVVSSSLTSVGILSSLQMGGDIDMGSYKITNLLNGTAPGDAVNYAQLSAATAGLNPIDPILTPNVIDDSLSIPPGSPSTGDAYLVSLVGTGDWSGKDGHLMEWDGSSWVDVLGAAVSNGDRFGVTMELSTGAAGGLAGNDKSIATITSNTPGFYTYTFTSPANTLTTVVDGINSRDLGHLYYYNGGDSAWVDLPVGFYPVAGNGLFLNGATLSIDTTITVDKNTGQTLTNKDLSSGTNTFPTFNQNTTGSAASLTTTRAIYGNNFNGTADLTQVITSTYGGTGNGFAKFSGPATSEKTFTLPNASATILTSNAAVTVAQGGTGLTTVAANSVLASQTTTDVVTAVAIAASQLFGRGSSGDTAAIALGTGLTMSGTTLSVNTAIPQNSNSANYTLTIDDAGKHIFHPSADTTARTWTIPANSSVAFPVGTAVTFVNQNAGGVITIAITTDTMRLAGAGTTGSRSLAANGVATALKITSTEWIISGTGLS